MAYDYDALYRTTPDALGAPTKALARLFARFEGQGLDVLDVGCGQGRDALPLARAGHRVHGLDLSPAGIACLLAAAEAEGLAVTGEVADLTLWRPARPYDLVLVDRTLHMLPEADLRLEVCARLCDAVAPGGHLLIADEAENIAAFRASLGPGWTLAASARTHLLARRAG